MAGASRPSGQGGRKTKGSRSEQQDGHRAQPAEHAVIAAHMPEEQPRGRDDGERQQPERPGRQENEVTLIKDAGRILKQDFEHEVQSTNSRDHDMDVRIAAGSYKESQIGGKFDTRAHSRKPSYVRPDSMRAGRRRCAPFHTSLRRVGVLAIMVEAGHARPLHVQDFIRIRGARVHNIKNISLSIPHNQLTVVTGVSGSGKSSLAFDTIYAEGQRHYVESLSAYARQFLEMIQKPDVDQIDGLSPAISIEQKTTSKNPRSTVGTVTEIYDYMRLLWARVGVPYSPATGLPIESQIVSQMVDRVLGLPEGTRLYLLAPVVRGRKGEYRKELAEYLKKGFQRVKIDGIFYELAEAPVLDKKFPHED